MAILSQPLQLGSLCFSISSLPYRGKQSFKDRVPKLVLGGAHKQGETMNRFKRIFGYLLLVASGCIFSLVSMANDPTYPSNATSVFVPFTNSTALPLSASPKIGIGFPNNQGTTSGTPFSVTMDTGSVGIYMGANYFTPPQNGVNDPSYVASCSETLTSSGVIYKGQLYKSSVNLYSGSHIVATASVPVCAISLRTCTTYARDCNPNESPNGVNYFGVGFGQEEAGQPNGTPDKNPFLNITQAGTLSPLPSYGYIITTQQGQPGVIIGLTPSNTQGYTLIGLSPYPAFPPDNPASTAITSEFQRAQANITVNGTQGAGSILFDTGVGTGYLSPPIGVNVSTTSIPSGAQCSASSTCVVSGTTVQVSFLGTAPNSSTDQTVIASFNYIVGSTANNPIAPVAVTLVKGSAPFLNTTLSFVNAFNYFYDGSNGFIGLQQLPTATAPSAGILAQSTAAPSQFVSTTPNAVGIQHLHRCFFYWVEQNVVNASDADKVTRYSSPYFYRYYPKNNTYVGVSTGKIGSTPSEVGMVHMGPADDKPQSDGSLSEWLAASGCK